MTTECGATPHTDAKLQLQRHNNKFTEQPWDTGRFDIQFWLQRAAWNTLQDTDYGRKRDTLDPSAAIMDDPLLSSVYKMDIATFLTAERCSMINISQMVSFAPDENSQVFLATQAFDESRHYEVFCRRLADIGVSPRERDALIEKMTLPNMKKFYSLIDEQVDKKDFVASLLSHNVVLEGMAYPLYRYEIKYWSILDPGLSSIVKAVFADEVQHVSYGENFIREAARQGSPQRGKIQKLAREYHQLMFDVFDEVINHVIGLYQEAADQYMDAMGDIEIFPGRRMRDISEKEQVELLYREINQGYEKRLVSLGL